MNLVDDLYCSQDNLYLEFFLLYCTVQYLIKSYLPQQHLVLNDFKPREAGKQEGLTTTNACQIHETERERDRDTEN